MSEAIKKKQCGLAFPRLTRRFTQRTGRDEDGNFKRESVAGTLCKSGANKVQESTEGVRWSASTGAAAAVKRGRSDAEEAAEVV